MAGVMAGGVVGGGVGGWIRDGEASTGGGATRAAELVRAMGQRGSRSWGITLSLLAKCGTPI